MLSFILILILRFSEQPVLLLFSFDIPSPDISPVGGNPDIFTLTLSHPEPQTVLHSPTDPYDRHLRFVPTCPGTSHSCFDPTNLPDKLFPFHPLAINKRSSSLPNLFHALSSSLFSYPTLFLFFTSPLSTPIHLALPFSLLSSCFSPLVPLALIYPPCNGTLLDRCAPASSLFHCPAGRMSGYSSFFKYSRIRRASKALARNNCDDDVFSLIPNRSAISLCGSSSIQKRLKIVR